VGLNHFLFLLDWAAGEHPKGTETPVAALALLFLPWRAYKLMNIRPITKDRLFNVVVKQQ
jgi:hypothetical protein